MLTVVVHGAFGTQVASSLEKGSPEAVRVVPWTAQFNEKQRQWDGDVVFCASSLLLEPLARIQLAIEPQSRVVGISVFERFVFISPPLGGERGLCANCYARRLSSHPPIPISSESFAFGREICENRLDFEYAGLHAGIREMVAGIARQQLSQPHHACALAIDIASLDLLNANVVPLHGCTCRFPRAAAEEQLPRFTRFVNELTL